MKHLGDATTRAEIVTRVRTVRPDSPRHFGAMSAPEMIVHCTDCLVMGLGQRSAVAIGSAFDRTIMKYAALYAPMRWPTGLRTPAEVNPKRSGTRPGDFASDVTGLVATIEQFGAHRTTWPVHPIFGVMSEPQWHRWGYLHTDHHLRQFGA